MNDSTARAMLGRLCSELRLLADAEVAAGNAIVDAGPSPHASDAPLILFAGPFRVRPSALPAGVDYREINDPHWWKAEYVHPASGGCVACRF